MKFIEIQTEEWDNETDAEVPTPMMVCLDKITSVQTKMRRQHNNENVPTVYIRAGDTAFWCFNYSYEQLKRILMSGSNIHSTGTNTTSGGSR